MKVDVKMNKIWGIGLLTDEQKIVLRRYIQTTGKEVIEVGFIISFRFEMLIKERGTGEIFWYRTVRLSKSRDKIWKESIEEKE